MEDFRQKYNPDGSELREAQLKMLSILDAVADMCDRNNIPYWLASGTLIGAIRHNGFIPWDDDLDIEILYKDRKRFAKACKNELPEWLALQSHATDKAYCMNILKVRDLNSSITELRNFEGKSYPTSYKYNGYFIDVFMEEPSTRFLVKMSRVPIRILSIAQYRWKLSTGMLNLVWAMASAFYGILRGVARCNPFGKYYYHSYGSWFMSRRVFSEMVPTSRHEFEGKQYAVPGNYDAFLRRIYGNYMTLPPEEKRRCSHSVKFM